MIRFANMLLISNIYAFMLYFETDWNYVEPGVSGRVRHTTMYTIFMKPQMEFKKMDETLKTSAD